MRVLIFVVIAAVVGAAGYFFYRQSATTAPEGGMFAEAPPPVLPTAEDCTVRDAVYEYNEDPRLQLRFHPIASGDEIEVLDVRNRQLGNVNFVIRATSLQTDYVFAPDNTFMSSGPRYQTVATYVRPASGGPRIQVSMFDTSMHYIDQLPRYDSVAPAYIYMPEVMRVLYAAHVDLPPGAFRFHQCEQSAQPATP